MRFLMPETLGPTAVGAREQRSCQVTPWQSLVLTAWPWCAAMELLPSSPQNPYAFLLAKSLRPLRSILNVFPPFIPIPPSFPTIEVLCEQSPWWLLPMSALTSSKLVIQRDY